MLKVFSHYFPSHTLQQILFDAFLLFVAVLVAVVMQLNTEMVQWYTVVPSALSFALLMVILNSAMGLYRPLASESHKNALTRVLLSIVVSIPVAYGIFGLLPWEGVASEAMQVSVLLLLGFVLSMRGLVNRRRASSLFAPRVLIIGTGTDAVAVQRALTHPVQSGMEIVGFFSPSGEDAIEVDARKVLGRGERLLDVVRKNRVNEIIVALRERRGGVLPLHELLDCKLSGVQVIDLSSFFERVQGQVRVDSLRASWLIYGDGFRQGVGRTIVKRCFDLAAATLLLVLTFPIMLVTALFILIEDGAPIFYRQERVGFGGRVFRVIKFRSMRTDAEKDGKPRWASSNDDRATRVGRVIRKLRIDELPQLFNVFVGDMSLVGPRPERPYFVDQLAKEIPFYAVRHCVKPGVTGWAQVRYQYGSSVDDAIQKLQYDLYYVKNHTLVLDTLVLFETVRVVLTGEGAH
ncbi:TIGR03013 family PEP-CTERM/XrtA system glycosyltransferase [Azoarcus indigens]|uniref:Sugar transferase (PEP-CTERM system associated)/exopolysaccharide biosynthesis polyprenyl glycosylphosphotransferase n=1 Tax=Azoarcus indigens TaxID=29545 RepID=A0A4R6DJY1_9RHOO|nr:TIGR03013 family XrtA/PEP-CTERM system glycosyltransferase [Azoarcus indigens]NMG67207.1 TIGR03013 family PEP-CTERM/XrtA system glycosyltransferase [Azoarcus indigens]TDN44519.1 sugar transferase (PEP-CTERM system associated)/exopolysaccharide biosynthesis polyprenyl glycosylphosphotransferase [Azoarcus indigens]